MSIIIGRCRYGASFLHPDTKEPIHVLLDPCHILKLVRNTFGGKKFIVDPNGIIIRYDYVVKLKKKMQEASCNWIALTNKLRSLHIQYFN